MKDKALTLWKRLDNYKTIIGTYAFLGEEFCTKFLVGVWGVNVDPRIPETLSWIAIIFGGVGVSHKLYKKRKEAQ